MCGACNSVPGLESPRTKINASKASTTYENQITERRKQDFRDLSLKFCVKFFIRFVVDA